MRKKNQNFEHLAAAGLGEWLLLWRRFGAGSGSEEAWEAEQFGSKDAMSRGLWERFGRDGEWSPSPCSPGWVAEVATRGWAERSGAWEVRAVRRSGRELDVRALSEGWRGRGEREAAEGSSRWTSPWRVHPQWDGEGAVPGSGLRRRRWGRGGGGAGRIGAGARMGEGSRWEAELSLSPEWGEIPGLGGREQARLALGIRKAMAKALDGRGWWGDWWGDDRRWCVPSRSWKDQGRRPRRFAPVSP